MVKTPASIIDDHVSSAKAAEIFDTQLKHDETRQYITSIVDAYVNSVPFMKKVREYASDEMDARLFTSAKFWIVTIVSAAVTALIGLGFGHYLLF